MQAIVSTIASWIGWLGALLRCYLDTYFFCALFNFVFDVLTGLVTVAAGAISWVPVPSELQSWTWPDPGPIGQVLIESGFVQGMGIVAAAMTIKFLLRLIPL